MIKNDVEKQRNITKKPKPLIKGLGVFNQNLGSCLGLQYIFSKLGAINSTQ